MGVAMGADPNEIEREVRDAAQVYGAVARAGTRGVIVGKGGGRHRRSYSYRD